MEPKRTGASMAVLLRFSTDALLSCRFAISPLHETMNAVRLLARPTAAGFHAPWLRAIAPAVEGLDLTPLALLTPPRSYGPDFLSPPPSGPTTGFADQLAVVRATAPGQVRAEIERSLTGRYGAQAPEAAEPLRRNATTARDLCADLLAECWTCLVEPWWPRIRAVLEADIAYRARVLADAGLAVVLTDLHPQVQWKRNTLRVDLAAVAEREVAGNGLVLMPGVFGGPGLGVAYDPPWPPTLDYAARGIASLWSPQARPAQPLVRLIGTQRALLLAALTEPASTTGLAARCGRPTSSVSEHLAVLRQAGLVTTRRTGRYLQHSRTPLGTTLANGDTLAEPPGELPTPLHSPRNVPNVGPSAEMISTVP